MVEPREGEPLDPVRGAAAANRMIAEGHAGNLIGRLGFEYVELGPDRVVARMPVQPNTQPYGMLHGGATAVLCETVASVGTALAVGLDKVVTGIELNVNHIRAAREGHVTVTAEPLHIGRTTAVWDMRVHDDEERLVAVSRLTLAIRDAPTNPR
jgi:1,4-dihydroxy-2-naphthoyl-CoA hydrolase